MTEDGLLSLRPPVYWVVIWNNQRHGFPKRILAEKFAESLPGAWVLPVARFP